ncbi:MAG: long-chain-fatty-acid--CoA ligase [Actinomycetota bacterium]|jgi:long-chain acyl-CoA synthetase|nr:MAG: long-chain-fatty-acid--CoA ligase [Actinomycetota bacterium]
MTDHRPWFASWPADVPTTLEPYPEISAFEYLRRSAERFGDRPATAFFGKRLTYRELLRQVERFSAVLVLLGVRQRDRVGLLLPNCPQFVIAWYACQRIGAIAVANNPLYTQRELEHQLTDAGVEVMVVLDQVYENFGKVRDAVGIREVVATKITDAMRFPLNVLAPLKFRREARHEHKPWPPIPEGARVRWWSDLMRRAELIPPVADVDPRRDPAAFVYTGGTTGSSKGAMLSHFNLVANALQARALFSEVIDGEDSILCVLPFFHSFGLVAMNLGLGHGLKLAMLPRFDLKLTLKELARERVTLFPGVPRLYIALNESPLTAKYDLKSLKACISGASPLPQAVADRFAEVTGGAQVVEGYGLTEASPVTHVNPIKGRRKEGSIGLPIPDTDCRIVSLDDPDRELPPGERGELCIKGPQVMLGYWRRPDATAEAIRNGWLHTGDVAVMDPDGYFRIVDRIKELILVSGFNVYPTEIEEVIYRHPKVLKVSVVGVPDEVTGERVKAFVVPRPGETLTAEELDAFCRDPASGLAGYRVPKEWEFRESLPETLIGKVLRRVLLEEELQKRRAAGSA